jgi:hypothetical protein
MAKYSDEVKRQALERARVYGAFRTAEVTGIPRSTISGWLKKEQFRALTAARPPGAIAPNKPPAVPNIGKLDAKAFHYQVQNYILCCGAHIAYNFGWPGGRQISEEGIKELTARFNTSPVTMFGITNPNQRGAAEVMAKCGWLEQENFMGTHGTRLKSWVFVPDRRKVKVK